MKREYDFSNAARGKFFRPDLDLAAPIYLEPAIRLWLELRAESRGTTVDQLVNELLRKDIDLIEVAK